MKKAPKKKSKGLIEGKYSHKFLTRLNPVEGKALTEIMKSESIKGYCAAVTEAVVKFKPMQDEISKLRIKNAELQNMNGQIVDTVSDYIAVTKRLHSLKL